MTDNYCDYGINKETVKAGLSAMASPLPITSPLLRPDPFDLQDARIITHYENGITSDHPCKMATNGTRQLWDNSNPWEETGMVIQYVKYWDVVHQELMARPVCPRCHTHVMQYELPTDGIMRFKCVGCNNAASIAMFGDME